MSNVSSGIKNWSTTEANNQPDTADAFTITGDVRAVQVAVKYLYSQDTIASATTTDLGSKDAASLTVSGTTTITGLGTVDAGIRKKVIFSGALTLTHNGTSLILPGAANITTVANDRAEFESLGSGNWRCNYYIRGDGTALLPFTDTSPIVRGSADPTKQVRFEVDGLTTATTRVLTVPDSSFEITGNDLSQTFTNKNINLTDNTLTGTMSQFDTACTDGNFAYQAQAASFTTITTTSGQIAFPATQNASAGANVLDDYEEGTWTPVLTFGTPGNLSVSYSEQLGEYTKVGRLVTVCFSIITSAFTHTTAANSLLFNGLPFSMTAGSGGRNIGATVFSGIAKVGYTQFVTQGSSAAAPINIIASGSGVAASTVVAADVPSGGTVRVSAGFSFAATA
jgi:hypothetical protein